MHLTNIVGTGAVQLVTSLLPALERCRLARASLLYLPDRGELAHYKTETPGLIVQSKPRKLPNALSRLVECVFTGRSFDDPTPLLVLGDLPLRSRCRQVVLVHTLHLTQSAPAGSAVAALKYMIARFVFRLNIGQPAAFIVQTPAMKTALLAAHPEIEDKVHVIAQPVPTWLSRLGVKRTNRRHRLDAPLSLFYPAADYPHKNHRLLSGIAPRDSLNWPVSQLTLTIDSTANPNRSVPWITCTGLLAPAAVVAIYAQTDAVLMMSHAESYGFPLVEAMWTGLPIVCPDLPYARTLCGEQAIYFDPNSLASLQSALQTLHRRLSAGWWPDWSSSLASIPRDWDAVAEQMVQLLLTSSSEEAV